MSKLFLLAFVIRRPNTNRDASTKTGIVVDDVAYEWPQGFAQFALDAMNPNIGELDEELKKEFEEILDTPLRVIYQHI
jgi:hypothetical protein